MKRLDYIEHLLSILCFDSLQGGLDIVDRINLHKEINRNRWAKDEYVLPTDFVPSNRIQMISDTIKATKWQRPELRYNSDRMLEIFNEEIGVWQLIKINQYDKAS